MPKRKKVEAVMHEHLLIQVTEHAAYIDGGINPEIFEPRRYWHKCKVYTSSNNLELTGVCRDPEDRSGSAYRISIHGDVDGPLNFDAILDDYHARDDSGNYKYRRRGDREMPVYDPPDSIGLLQRNRETAQWNGWCWLPLPIVSDMIALAFQTPTLYLALHEIKVGRHYKIRGIALYSREPEDA